MNQKILYLLSALLLAACVGDPVGEVETEFPSSGIVYAPVYADREMSSIQWTGARGVKNPGKIYVYGDYLLVNEINEGIHVFDNSDPADPIAVGFIQMLGNTDMAIKDNNLYADYMGDIAAVAINDFVDIEENAKLPVQSWSLGLPPPAGAYFECVDGSKGLVTKWVRSEKTITDCYAIQ